MEILLILIFGFILFIIFGVAGWFFKLFGYVFDFLLEGFFTSLGCMFWVFIIVVILAGLVA